MFDENPMFEDCGWDRKEVLPVVFKGGKVVENVCGVTGVGFGFSIFSKLIGVSLPNSGTIEEVWGC